MKEHKGETIIKEDIVILDKNKIGEVKDIPVSILDSEEIYGWIILNDKEYEKVKFKGKQFKSEKCSPHKVIHIKYCYYNPDVLCKVYNTNDVDCII
jgi:hypothetical protein